MRARDGLSVLGPAARVCRVLASAAGVLLVGPVVDWLRVRLFSLLNIDEQCCRWRHARHLLGSMFLEAVFGVLATFAIMPAWRPTLARRVFACACCFRYMQTRGILSCGR